MWVWCICHKHLASQLSLIFSTRELNVSSYFLCHIVPLGVIPTKSKLNYLGANGKWGNKKEAADDMDRWETVMSNGSQSIWLLVVFFLFFPQARSVSGSTPSMSRRGRCSLWLTRCTPWPTRFTTCRGTYVLIILASVHKWSLQRERHCWSTYETPALTVSDIL